MASKHPHAEATYRIVFLEDKGYGVQVSIPDTSPTTVTIFATEQEAERWIVGHRQRAQNEWRIRKRRMVT
jgi:hypothetical protein